MTPPPRALPSISALRAFAVAARHLNFTAAAEELSLTQSAVSHQIRELESRLEAKLFHRTARGLSLTKEGQNYLPFVGDALESLRAGERALTPTAVDTVLTVSCSPNFAQKWLIPRLGSFLEENADIDLRISAAAHHVAFEDDGIDIAIRHGDGNWPGFVVTRLCKEWVFPVVSPHLVQATHPIESISDFQHFVLLHDQQREGWDAWLKTFNINPAEFDLGRGPVFSQTSLAIDAAVASQGITLARSALVELDVQLGRLIRPVEQRLAAHFAYWIVHPKTNHLPPKIEQLTKWLVAQVNSID